MKYIYIIFIFITGFIFSQDLERINQSEVIFILHEGINSIQQSKSVFQKFKNQRTSFSYKFYFSEKDKYSSQKKEITFVYNHYHDFDERENENPVPYFSVNKSFLKKNKNIIITGKLMRKMGYVESLKLMNKAKTIFLIDKSEIKNKEITIKGVRHFYIGEE